MGLEKLKIIFLIILTGLKIQRVVGYWVYISVSVHLYSVVFIFQTNHTRINLEAEGDLGAHQSLDGRIHTYIMFTLIQTNWINKPVAPVSFSNLTKN